MKQATEVIAVLHKAAVLLTFFMVVPIHINHEDDEPDVGSDEEEFLLEHGNFHDGIFSFGDVFINPGSREGGGLFVHRRHRGNGILSSANNININIDFSLNNRPPTVQPIKKSTCSS
jgi:hypothetical protein